MTKINKKNLSVLSKTKKDTLRKMMGQYSSQIDLNKVRDEYKKW